ncbi:HEAT repeat domain-containing protein [Solirubrobacter taibaiensis]|nr:HEAT repeat domain-containing protein [Solirubrobacter taibaiensis]
MAKKRIALRPQVSSDDVDGAAWELDWPIVATLAKTEDRPKQDVYRGDEDDTRVYLIHDDVLQLRYLIIDGPSADKVAKAAQGKLDTISVSDAEQLFDAADSADDRATATLLLGVASDHGKVSATLKTAATDDAKAVRRAAVIALGLVETAAAKDLLAKISEDDEDEVVRGDAEATLKELGGA